MRKTHVRLLYSDVGCYADDGGTWNRDNGAGMRNYSWRPGTADRANNAGEFHEKRKRSETPGNSGGSRESRQSIKRARSLNNKAHNEHADGGD